MTGPPPYQVLIVEDHQVVAEGLSVLLSEYPELVVIGVAGSVAEVDLLAPTERIDVAVADYWLPDGTGLDRPGALGRYWPAPASPAAPPRSRPRRCRRGASSRPPRRRSAR